MLIAGVLNCPLTSRIKSTTLLCNYVVQSSVPGWYYRTNMFQNELSQHLQRSLPLSKPGAITEECWSKMKIRKRETIEWCYLFYFFKVEHFWKWKKRLLLFFFFFIVTKSIVKKTTIIYQIFVYTSLPCPWFFAPSSMVLTEDENLKKWATDTI